MPDIAPITMTPTALAAAYRPDLLALNGSEAWDFGMTPDDSANTLTVKLGQPGAAVRANSLLQSTINGVNMLYVDGDGKGATTGAVPDVWQATGWLGQLPHVRSAKVGSADGIDNVVGITATTPGYAEHIRSLVNGVAAQYAVFVNPQAQQQ